MIFGFTKTMHTYIVGQPNRSSNTQKEREDDFIYAFSTTIRQSDIPFKNIPDVVIRVLADVMRIPLENIKDLEISLDIPSGLYTVRFSTSRELGTDYAYELLWSAHNRHQSYETITETYPVDYATDNDYTITPIVTPLSIDELKRLAKES